MYKDIVVTFGANLFVLIAGLLGGIISARILGPYERGGLAAAFVWTGLFVALGDLGIPQALIYSLSKSRAHAGKIIGTTVLTSIALGLLLAGIGIFIIIPLLLSTGAEMAAATYYIASLPIIIMLTFLSAVLQGLGKIRSYNTARILQSLGYLIVLGVIAIFELGLATTIIWFLIIVHCCVIIYQIYEIHKQTKISTWEVSLNTAFELLRYGIKAYPGNLAWTANGKIDQIFISSLLTANILGIYAVSASYASVLMGLSSAFATVVFQRVASAASNSDAYQLLRRALYGSVTITAPLAALFIVAAPYLLPVVFGLEYQDGTGTARILSFCSVIIGMNFILSNGLRGLGKPMAPSFAELTGFIVIAFTIRAFYKNYGMEGIAWSICSGGLAVSITLFTFLWVYRYRSRTIDEKNQKL
jgi:O-antigen/teichoic acid export membrane protein